MRAVSLARLVLLGEILFELVAVAAVVLDPNGLPPMMSSLHGGAASTAFSAWWCASLSLCVGGFAALAAGWTGAGPASTAPSLLSFAAYHTSLAWGFRNDPKAAEAVVVHAPQAVLAVAAVLACHFTRYPAKVGAGKSKRN
jgi:hypothetical protein|eukprot:TRINITY_DN6228_c0_g1_i1.p1 TRINITY_DN6228_c0_g1~~TRINITY_DN6228_c0_g1_i1.p1  ORF type:complete len:141 (-),score=17.83 TRINITY_DN6228_c0_g1_i1:8-430(-)